MTVTAVERVGDTVDLPLLPVQQQLVVMAVVVIVTVTVIAISEADL